MTVFRLNAGRPARSQTGGSSARSVKEAVDTPIRYVPPNSGEFDAHLACGCTIPWPVIVEFGGHLHGQVLCSEHGYQPQITKTEIARIRREAKKWHNDDALTSTEASQRETPF